MPNLDLVGQVPVQIDHVYAITLTNLSVKVSTPTKVPKGAFGPIGSAQGIPDVSGTIKLVAPKTGLEFNLIDLGKKPSGFTVTYELGALKFHLVGCRFSEKDVAVDQGAGTVEITVNFVATEEIPG